MHTEMVKEQLLLFFSKEKLIRIDLAITISSIWGIFI